MKVLGIAILSIGASVYAQAPKPPTPPPPTVPVRPPTSPSTVLQPKHSEATANLELAEQKKANLQMKQQMIVQQVNQAMNSIQTQTSDQEKAATEAEAQIKKENGWGDDVMYIPPQSNQDGSTTPGKWQKMDKPKAKP